MHAALCHNAKAVDARLERGCGQVVDRDGVIGRRRQRLVEEHGFERVEQVHNKRLLRAPIGRRESRVARKADGARRRLDGRMKRQRVQELDARRPVRIRRRESNQEAKNAAAEHANATKQNSTPFCTILLQERDKDKKKQQQR